MDVETTPYYLFLLVLVLAPPVLILIERLRPSIKAQPVFRREFSTDVGWYLIAPLLQRIVAPLFVVFLVVLPVYMIADLPLSQYRYGFGPVAALPPVVQTLLALVLFDFCFYWHHRLFHRPAFWNLHSIHHSSETLDWLSATRVHPVNEIGGQLLTVTPMILLGFTPAALLVLLPVLAATNLLLHANVDWDFGPFRRVIISPRFHRWHHSKEAAAKDKNFAAVFPVWDILFGTYYLPPEKPERFGVPEEIPSGFWAQMRYPFRVGKIASKNDRQ